MLAQSHRASLVARLGILFLLLLAGGSRCELAAQGQAVTLHAAILRSGPAQAHKRIDLIPSGEVLTLLPHGHVTGYYRVLTQDEEVGWVTESALRLLDATELHHTADSVATAPNDPTTAVAVEAGDFDGCGVAGDPSPNGWNYVALKAWNTLKNRSVMPSPGDVDQTVTLSALVGTGINDSARFSTGKAAEVTGYVLHVKPGGKTETTNCRKGDPVHRDAHIELTLSPTDTMANRRVIVEVTPRWRAAMKTAGTDWATEMLQQSIEGKWIQVRGWLFFDAEHKSDAENTNPGGDANWRATVWEIHPVTSLRVVPH